MYVLTCLLTYNTLEIFIHVNTTELKYVIAFIKYNVYLVYILLSGAEPVDFHLFATPM